MKKLLLLLLSVCVVGAVYGSADIPLSVTTAATGTNFTALPSQQCTYVLIINTTGTDLTVDRGGSGNTWPLPNGNALKLNVNGNANEISLKRTDSSNTQVTVAVAAGKSSV